MGTTTFYLKHNDFGRSLKSMSKKEIETLGNLSPYGKDNSYLGWTVPCELHNGNVYILIFWQGRLMRLEQAAKTLTDKYYDKHRGKTLREYEWTLLKNYIVKEVEYMDDAFKKSLRKRKKAETHG